MTARCQSPNQRTNQHETNQPHDERRTARPDYQRRQGRDGMNASTFEAVVRTATEEYINDTTDGTGTDPDQRQEVAGEILRDIAGEAEDGDL